MGLTTLAVGVAAVLDGAVGEPPRRVHPVAWFGRVVGAVDREWGRPRLVGFVAALCLPLVAAGVTGGVVLAAALVRPTVGAVTAGVVLFVTTSLRRLLVVGRRVTGASETDLDGARAELRALAGRDASTLSPGEVRSAVVESLAENLADGLVAPLLGFAVGGAVGLRLSGLVAGVGSSVVTLSALAPSPVLSLALASAGASWVKAVNTMDSMLGYRSKPVGWGPARLDDAVVWVPARVTAMLLAVVSLAPSALVAAREWLGGVPSPNSGWPMGTLAAALGVRLVKPGVYTLGDGSLPTVADAERARRRVAAAGGLAYLLAGVVAWG
ncbi:CobD/CbiB family cobalamin biosynthesis protein [Halobacteriales archaeon QH_10_67_22]|nr:MAG: CobD/CbiB family cobalamin biosynthesis protein [Halobacteriales archaeon QH_10_67_22]